MKGRLRYVADYKWRKCTGDHLRGVVGGVEERIVARISCG